MVDKKIVCLGGGVGTANLLRGLRKEFSDLTAIVSMADDGGSAGRLRRFFKVPPPGDIINCMSALSDADETMQHLLKYRFAGDRYGDDSSIPGQKIGNLLFVALTDITGDFPSAIRAMQRIFKINGKIYPSTTEDISIWAETSTGERVEREENIDLGKFSGKIEKLHIHPENPNVSDEVINAIANASAIIAGPGDLYTTILPVIVIPKILEALKKSKAQKFFVVNVANKVNETPSFSLEDFARAIEKHCGSRIFNTFIMNSNTSVAIASEWQAQYSFVSPIESQKNGTTIIATDLVDESFPLYHSPLKLAKAIKAAV